MVNYTLNEKCLNFIKIDDRRRLRVTKNDSKEEMLMYEVIVIMVWSNIGREMN